MQTDDDFDRMQICFAENDTAKETLRAVAYLDDQLYQLADSGALTEGEFQHAPTALDCLNNLREEVEGRKTREQLSEANIEGIADALDEVYTLTGDIMEELTDSSSTMEKIDYPHTNPHTAAEDSGKAAQDRADALRTLIQDDH